MFARLIELCSAFLFVGVLTISPPGSAFAGNDGIITVKSAYPIGETVERLKKDIADKGIKFFSEIDQSRANRSKKAKVIFRQIDSIRVNPVVSPAPPKPGWSRPASAQRGRPHSFQID